MAEVFYHLLTKRNLLPLTIYVTLDKALNASVPSILNCKEQSSFLIELSRGMNKTVYLKKMDRCLGC